MQDTWHWASSRSSESDKKLLVLLLPQRFAVKYPLAQISQGTVCEFARMTVPAVFVVRPLGHCVHEVFPR
jgi:hypothetical protein